MRILFLSNSFPNAISMARGMFNMNLLRALAARHEVHVVSPVSWTDELCARMRGRRIKNRNEQFAENLTASYPRFYYPPRFARHRYGEWLWWSLKGELARVAREFHPDAVVSYWAHPDGEAAVKFARRERIPAVTMVGGSDVLILAREARRRRAIEAVFEAADAIVPVSHNIADELLSWGLPPERIHVVPRGINRQQFYPADRAAARERLNLPAEGNVLVAVGRLVPVKGFDTLLEAMHLLEQLGTSAHLHILGGGPLAGALARQIGALQLQDIVTLHGAVSQETLPDWYRAANLTVLSSLSEGIPNVLLESIACGTPFVATHVGGVPEIADANLHTLVAPGQAEELAPAIARRLQSPQRNDHRPRFVPIDWSESAERLVEVLEGCIASRNQRINPVPESALTQ